MKERFWRASQAFDVTIRNLPQPIGKQHLEVTWVRNEKFHERSQLVDGCYLLRTNLTGVDPATLWKRYIQLTEAEWAFRIAKDELAIRPVWHQKEDRVRSHVLICFLAYAMWKTLAGWMKGAGLGDAPARSSTSSQRSKAATSSCRPGQPVASAPRCACGT
ncbi:MAG: hypothetical protein FJ286_07390 [Planctomycetes bacterium]|nr:hypothetical protein [Planctomycetota bacterium]